jgi:protein-disulfide isomerase
MMSVRWSNAVAGLLLLALVQLAEAGGVVVTEDGRVRGSADAPITLLEYSDFTCGYCAKFFQETWPRLQAKYIDTGKVRFAYRDFPRSDRGIGVEAAVAARCAGAQGQYWQMHDRLFSERGRLDSGSLKTHAKAIGLDQPAFDKCFVDRAFLASIFQDRQEANRWGFHGTPGFILMRTAGGPTEQDPAVSIPGAVPFEDFAEEIDRMLATAPRSQGGLMEPYGATAVAQSSQFIIH